MTTKQIIDPNSFKPATRTIVGFFRKSSIRKKIEFFIEECSNGYEKWVQFELLNYLSKNDAEIRSVEIERPFSLKRNMGGKGKAYIDLVYQKKKQKNDFLHAIELKVRVKTVGAIQGLIADLNRLQHITEEEFKFRSITAVAIFNTDSGDGGKYLNFIDDLGKVKRVKIYSIPLKNKYKLLVICWTIPPRLVRKESFDDFSVSIKDIAKIHDIKLRS